MINPFDLCRSLLTIGTYSSLLQEYIIKLTPDSWIVKAKAEDYIATIRPTEFNTIEFTIPVACLDDDSDEVISEVISSTEFMNGQLSIVSTSKGVVLFYSTYLPKSIIAESELVKFGLIILKEIKFIKDGLTVLRSRDSGMEPGSLNADRFDNMMEDFNSSKDEEGNK